MPAKSQAQQKAAGMAHAAKEGEIPPSTLRGAARYMYENMSRDDLEEIASTKHKGLPKKKGKPKKATAKRKR